MAQKKYRGLSRVVGEGLSEKIKHQLKFRGWIDVNQTKKKKEESYAVSLLWRYPLLGKVKTICRKPTALLQTVISI